MAEVVTAAGVSAETLRKIETGRPSTPAFFAVAALAAALHASLDELAAAWAHAPDWPPLGLRSGRRRTLDRSTNARWNVLAGDQTPLANIEPLEPGSEEQSDAVLANAGCRTDLGLAV